MSNQSHVRQNQSLPLHQIVGLDHLFLDENDPNERHFPQGSTLVISGSPGAGKTTFALALVRSMIRDQSVLNIPKPKQIVYYVSTEVDRYRLKGMFGSRGWFDEDPLFCDPIGQTTTAGFHVIRPPLEIERPVKSSEELVNYIVRQIAVQPPPEPGQFVFIVIDSITSLFRDSIGGGDSRRQIHELIFRLRNQFPRPSENDSGAGNLGMILMLSEEGEGSSEPPGFETYVSDFVIRLGLKPLSMGTRLRTLEVVKAQGRNMIIGKHTWQIVTNQSLDRLIAGKTLRAKVKDNVKRTEGRDPDNHKWGTFIVASRAYFLPHSGGGPVRTGQWSSSGICGLDEMLRFDPDYWFLDPRGVIKDKMITPGSPKVHRAIKDGSVTMLVGEPGTGKTSICYHLIASHLTNPQAYQDRKALLVGFEHELRTSFETYLKKFKKKSDDVLRNCEFIYRPRSGLNFNFLILELREWLEVNRSANKRVVIDGISHLASTQTRQEFSQMLDALVTLFSEHPRQLENDGQIQSVGNSKSHQASLFLTYEATQNETMFDADTLRLPADNIIRFSHQVIEDVRRTAVTVIKSSHAEYDKLVRELVLDHLNPSSTHICSGFDAYSGLLESKVRKADVVLQLFQENARERAYNEAVTERLKKLLPYEIVHRDFSRFEISSSLDGKGENVKVPTGDVHLSHVDEWWVAHKLKVLTGAANAARRKEKKLRSAKKKGILVETEGANIVEAGDPEFTAWLPFRQFVSHHQMTKLPGIISIADESAIRPGDFWCFEMEKVWNPGKEDGKNKRNSQRHDASRDIGPYALPSYIDFGMMCVNRALIDPKVLQNCHSSYSTWDGSDDLPWNPSATDELRDFAGILTGHLRPWCDITPDEWFAEPRIEDPRTMVDLMQIGKNGGLHSGFAWDSRTPETAASFLYELAWAFGGTTELFSKNSEMSRKPVQRALSFMGYLVNKGLMPVSPTLTDTAQSAYSRHYYSTYIDVVERASSRNHQPVNEQPIGCVCNASLISLGFMPPGPLEWQDQASINSDREYRDKMLNKRKRKMEGLYPAASRAAYGTSPNQNDIDELKRWKSFRKLLDQGKNWKDVLENCRNFTGGRSVVNSDPKKEFKLRTGYGCCGAWALEVKSPTSAPGLAKVLLQELTSLTFAKKRARMGAGMPARQDFYRHYGDRPVTGMEYLTWSEMLMFLGSTARRRDRIYPSPYKGETEETIELDNDPAELHKLIHREVTNIMLTAATPEATPESITKAANFATAHLFERVHHKNAVK